ncbi:SET and MYND domain-containing protein DDB_G0273589 [Culex quinquefasciatus]|uniref:SET and MYND domain-containing protein DDB_G0273589 n=1 Tax=Culex quinquefasciatus TaxID=7176 RepID=UPI0018E32C07|nr:SET and MYND domain-containing protein DDB_G0273589 [Culex quinquefasciatus]
MDQLRAAINTLRSQFDLKMPRYRRRNTDIAAYRDFIAQRDPLINIPEMAKSNELADRHRQHGNRAYAAKRFDEALLQYNQSICFAERGSEQLGMGYANRSAVYYEQGEYEFALYNIDLARKHNYPEAMMPKLLAREVNCKKMIDEGNSKGTVPIPVVQMNVEVNPTIPFLAKGITMKQYGEMGRGLVAERDFTTGDVILDEKVDLCFVSCFRNYLNCGHCGSEFCRSLIPCLGCVMFMYCSEKCREQDLRITHRFECSVASKLFSVTDLTAMMMARLFFYGLTAFDDNVNKMMKYCLANAGTGSNPFELEFANLNRVDIFKVLHQTKARYDPTIEHDLKVDAAAYHLIFMKSPAVQAIFCTAAQRNFMLRCLLIHGRVASTLALNQKYEPNGFTANFSPLATVCNHSCDPNATTIVDSGSIKLIVLRPIVKGDQILTTYGPAWWRAQYCHDVNFDCNCPFCDEGSEGEKWQAEQDQAPMMPPNPPKDLFSTDGDTSNLVYKLGRFQRIVKFLAREHLGQLFGDMANVYHDALIEVVRQENRKRDRAKVWIGGAVNASD